VGIALTADEGHEFEEGDGGLGAEGDLFVEGGGLVVVDEEEDVVVLEGVAGFFELGFPVDGAWGFEFVAVEGGFGVGGLDEASEVGVGALLEFEVEVLDFLVYAGAEEFADGDVFGEEVEGEVGAGGVAGGGLVAEGDGGHEGAPDGCVDVVVERDGWGQGKNVGKRAM
jgi:hypothetical protein